MCVQQRRRDGRQDATTDSYGGDLKVAHSSLPDNSLNESIHLKYTPNHFQRITEREWDAKQLNPLSILASPLI